MSEGWKCPNCGKAHAPQVLTCPEPARDNLTHLPHDWHSKADWVRQWPFTVGDPPGTVSVGSTEYEWWSGKSNTRVIDPITGRDLGPSD